jgi:hypothetical protein
MIGIQPAHGWAEVQGRHAFGLGLQGADSPLAARIAPAMLKCALRDPA